MKAWGPVAVAIACVLLLAPLATAKGSGMFVPVAAQDPVAPGDAERNLFTRGQNLVLQGSHTQAAEVLERFLQVYPNSIITDLAFLWLGRAYFQLRRFTEAEELGKRLRAIQDTPFSDIYETELRTARREAAAQQASKSKAESVQPRRQPRSVSSSAPPPVGRSRLAKPGTTPRSASTGQKNPVTGTPAANKSARPGVSKKSTPQVARRRDTPASGSLKPPSLAANKTKGTPLRPQPRREANTSNSLQPRPRNVNRPSRTMVTANSTPNPRGRSSAPKTSAPSRSSRSNLGSGAGLLASKPTGSKRGPGKVASNSAVPRDTRPKRITTSTTSRAVGSTQARRKRPVDAGNDIQQPIALSQHAATGGLYSMMEPVVAPAPTSPPAPANTPQQTQLAANSKTLNAKPGEKVYLSFVVRNYGSTRETYELRITAPGAPEAQLYVDSNGDGMHQSDELRVTGAPVVELKNSEVPFLLEVTVPRDAFEGQQYSYTVTVLAFGSGSVIARATSTLTVSSIRASLLPVTITADHAIQTR